MKTILVIIRWVFSLTTLAIEWIAKAITLVITGVILVIIGLTWPISKKWYDPSDKFIRWITNFYYVPMSQKVFSMWS